MLLGIGSRFQERFSEKRLYGTSPSLSRRRLVSLRVWM